MARLAGATSAAGPAGSALRTREDAVARREESLLEVEERRAALQARVVAFSRQGGDVVSRFGQLQAEVCCSAPATAFAFLSTPPRSGLPGKSSSTPLGLPVTGYSEVAGFTVQIRPVWTGKELSLTKLLRLDRLSHS